MFKIFFALILLNFGRHPMPVEMVYFYHDITDNHVVLKWGTATEVENYGFEIQRSSNLAQWDSLDFVFGFGTSFIEHDYEFTDTSISVKGTYYYRLKQIDTNFHFEYSDTVTVNYSTVDIKEKFPYKYDIFLYQNYPNPFNPETIIKFKIPALQRERGDISSRSGDGLVTLKVYDILGNEIATLINSKLNAGLYELNFNAEKFNLSAGVYFLKLESDNNFNIKKLLFLK